MGKKDPRIDGYIEKSADFAKPILKHIRKVVHAACPEVEETIKWGMPHFVYKEILCGMAAFKQHCAIWFWKSKLLFGDNQTRDKTMGDFGRITALRDLPNDRTLTSYIKKAAKLNELGVKKAPRAKTKRRELVVPDDLQAALRKNERAQQNFDNFSYSHRREYIEWLTSAKRDQTRAKRLATALEWLAEGKPQNWKYMEGRK
jgi:uncharacterized protein YdeI (YjbR/CyaY-like superfamily)